MPAGRSEACSFTQVRIILRSRRVNSGVFSSGAVAEIESEPESETTGGDAGAGGASFALALLAGGGGAALDAVEVTKVNTASDSTNAGRLPVAAAAPVPAAPPAIVPMAAPLPPPAIAPITAPKAAPPPIFVTLLFECDSPLMMSGSTWIDAATVPELTVLSARSSSPGSLSRPVGWTSVTRPMTSAPFG